MLGCTIFEPFFEFLSAACCKKGLENGGSQQTFGSPYFDKALDATLTLLNGSEVCGFKTRKTQVNSALGHKNVNKVFAKFLQKKVENFPDFLAVFFWNIEEMIGNDFQQKWIEVFEKVKEIATIPEIIKICHLLREIEKPRKIRKSSMTMQMSLIFSNNLELHKLMISITPNMWAYLHYILVHN